MSSMVRLRIEAVWSQLLRVEELIKGFFRFHEHRLTLSSFVSHVTPGDYRRFIGVFGQCAGSTGRRCVRSAFMEPFCCIVNYRRLNRYALDPHTFLHLLTLTLVSIYFGLSGTKATSVTFCSSSTKSTATSPLDNVPNLG